MSHREETGNRAVVADMVGALNDGDIDRFASYYTDDVEVDIIRFGRRLKGNRAVGEWIEDAFDALDGFCNDVIGIYGDGGVIALEVIARGTAKRPFAGRSVGEPLDAQEVYIYTFRNGKIADVRAY